MLCVPVDDKLFARFIIKLRHEDMSRSEFVRVLMQAYVEDENLIDDFFDDYRKNKKKYPKWKQKILDKEREVEQEISEQFAFDEKEIQDIYDLLEEELDV